jgi:hypothetical protein
MGPLSAGTGATERAAVAAGLAPAAADNASKPLTARTGIPMRDARTAWDLAREPSRPEAGSALLCADFREINCMALLYGDRTARGSVGRGSQDQLRGKAHRLGPPLGKHGTFIPQPTPRVDTLAEILPVERNPPASGRRRPCGWHRRRRHCYGVQLWMPEAGGRVDYASEHGERATAVLGLSRWGCRAGPRRSPASLPGTILGMLYQTAPTDSAMPAAASGDLWSAAVCLWIRADLCPGKWVAGEHSLRADLAQEASPAACGSVSPMAVTGLVLPWRGR